MASAVQAIDYLSAPSGDGLASRSLETSSPPFSASNGVVFSMLTSTAASPLAVPQNCRRSAGVVFAWIFNLWGSADLLNAFYQANSAGLLAGQLGAAYFIPTFVVPLLLITHGLVFRILLQHQNESAGAQHEAARPSPELPR
jgi:hypothetical protein